jgi:hypothetical protein
MDFSVSQGCRGEIFESVDECVLAAFDEGIERMSRQLVAAAECEKGWHDRVRAGLEAVLAFLDKRPGWARFLVLDPPVATVSIAERRRHALAQLARGLERETRGKLPDSGGFTLSPRLTAELVVGGVFAAVRGQMLERPGQSLSSLAPSLIAFVERPYCDVDCDVELRAAVPARRVTYRTGRVLGAIGAAARSNNREIAEAAGLRDEGQTSKLLSRLERRGLIENVGLGAAYGEPNAWLLTASGERVLEDARRHLQRGAGGRATARVGGAA